ncbi:MAG: hypothetical protein J6J42_10425 [Lachnospiraceae bacterium]|nr:hypothetical protein [Lachnospiraceae bacterium]
MLEVKSMSIEKFMETKKEANTAQLMLMYRHVNAKSKFEEVYERLLEHFT